jgi:hypothetical protein
MNLNFFKIGFASVFVILLLLSGKVCHAQIDYIGRPTINYVNSHHKVWDIKGVYFTGRYGASTSFIKYKSIDENNHWFIGTGIHGTLSFLSQGMYTTAATSVIKNSNNWFAFSFSDIDEKLDTLILNQRFNFFSNLYIALQYRYNFNHELGLQVDLLGISLGLPVDGKLVSTALSNNQIGQRALPTLFNYTLVGSNNRGSLMYALNYRYWFNDRLGANAGINYTYSEYRTSERLLFGNSRFRQIGFCFMIGISYAPFHKKYRN